MDEVACRFALLKRFTSTGRTPSPDHQNRHPASELHLKVPYDSRSLFKPQDLPPGKNQELALQICDRYTGGTPVTENGFAPKTMPYPWLFTGFWFLRCGFGAIIATANLLCFHCKAIHKCYKGSQIRSCTNPTTCSRYEHVKHAEHLHTHAHY